MNPNNCNKCEHKQNPGGGFCYMFRLEPKEVCAKHTKKENLAQSHEKHLRDVLILEAPRRSLKIEISAARAYIPI